MLTETKPASSVESDGYASSFILQQTIQNTRLILNSSKQHIRDSAVFDEVQYNYPFSYYILSEACQRSNHLTVLDYGGALGSSYLYLSKTISKLAITFNWNIVEQPPYISVGNELFCNDPSISFYNSFTDLKYDSVDLIVLSGVLMYLRHPLLLLRQLLDHFPSANVLIDRTIIHSSQYQNTSLTVQKIKRQIFGSKVSSWIFNESIYLIYLIILISPFLSTDDPHGLTYSFKAFIV